MTVKIETTAATDWTATGNWTNDPTHVTAWFGSNFLAESNAISGLELLENQEVYRMPAGTAIEWTLTPANGTAGQADAAMAAALTAAADEVGLSFRLHSADPGTGHTSNELTNSNEPGYARKTTAWRAVVA